MKYFATLLIGCLLAGQSIADDSDLFDMDEELGTARALIHEERYTSAINRLISIVVSDSGSADAWNLLGFASRKDGKLQKAAEAYEQALAIDPDHKGALEYQGELFVALGEREAAEANLDKLIALCPDSCEELEDLADALADM